MIGEQDFWVGSHGSRARRQACRYERSQGRHEGRPLGWILLHAEDPLRELTAAANPETSTAREAIWARKLANPLRKVERIRAEAAFALELADVERRGR